MSKDLVKVKCPKCGYTWLTNLLTGPCLNPREACKTAVETFPNLYPDVGTKPPAQAQ